MKINEFIHPKRIWEEMSHISSSENLSQQCLIKMNILLTQKNGIPHKLTLSGQIQLVSWEVQMITFPMATFNAIPCGQRTLDLLLEATCFDAFLVLNFIQFLLYYTNA